MRRLLSVKAALLCAVAFLCVGALALHGGEQAKCVRILYTTSAEGELKSCGCGGQKGGGLARRATLIAQLKKENPNTVIVDSGNIINSAGNRAEMMFQFMEEFGYSVIGLGQQEHLLSGDTLYDMAAKHGMTVLDSNPYANEKTRPYVVKNVGGVKIGIVSFGFVPQDQDPNEFSFRRAIYSVYKQARDASDVLIVLDQANRVTAEWLARNAPRLGAPDVVIGGPPQETVVGKTYLEPLTYKARQVGVIDIEIAPDGSRKVATQRIELSESIVPDDAVAKRIDAFERSGQVVLHPPDPNAPMTAAEKTALQVSQRTYYPSGQCKACHIKEYDDWAASKHSTALKTLKDAGRMLAECLPCHSEEYMRTQKVASSKDMVAGVECASCHFESLPHGLERKTVANRTQVSALKCLICHNSDRSPKYDEQVYFPKVMHKAAQSAANSPAVTQ